MAATNVNVQMQQRRDTAAGWTSANPTLLSGELGFETDTKKAKLGDGTTAWNSLSYYPGFAVSAYPLATADIADDAITAAKLADTSVTAGSYTAADITVDAQGRITAAANGEIGTSEIADGSITSAKLDTNITIAGDLTVNGTTTTINSTTLTVDDKNIEMGSVATPTDVTADGGGITLKGATDKTLTWVNSTDCWTFNQSLDLPAGSASAPALIFNGDTNTGIYSPGGDQVAISTGGTGRLFIDSSGRVGVGTSSPSNTLDVGTGNIEIGGGNNTALTWSSDVSSHYLKFTTALNGLTLNGYGGLAFETLGANERMRIDSSGNVGVGTSSPSSKLHISGGTVNTARIDGSSGGGGWLVMRNGSVTGGVINTGGWLSDTTSGLAVYAETGNDIRFYTNGTVTERMRIDTSGNVGIGTTSPGNMLHIEGSSPSIRLKVTSGPRHMISPFSGDLYIESDPDNTSASTNTIFTVDGTERMRIDSSGDVEIGSGKYLTWVASPGGSHRGRIKCDSGDSIVFENTNGNSERMRIDSSGRMLVGTSTSVAPNRKFQIAGADSASAAMSICANTNDVNGVTVDYIKSRNGTYGSYTIVQNNDNVAKIQFRADDGTDYLSIAASIAAEVDGTPGANDMPGRLVFSTTADGASSPTERMRITSSGHIQIDGRIYRSDAGSCGVLFSSSSEIVPQDNTGSNADNAVTLGSGSYRFSVVYAATGSINTSDATLKQDIEELDAAELSVATAIKGLIKKFRFVDAVINKGDDARIHVGVIAQEVEQAFVDAGLDPRRYALFCEDELEDGTKRLGIRYDELLAFVIAAL